MMHDALTRCGAKDVDMRMEGSCIHWFSIAATGQSIQRSSSFDIDLLVLLSLLRFRVEGAKKQRSRHAAIVVGIGMILLLAQLRAVRQYSGIASSLSETNIER